MLGYYTTHGRAKGSRPYSELAEAITAFNIRSDKRATLEAQIASAEVLDLDLVRAKTEAMFVSERGCYSMSMDDLSMKKKHKGKTYCYYNKTKGQCYYYPKSYQTNSNWVFMGWFDKDSMNVNETAAYTALMHLVSKLKKKLPELVTSEREALIAAQLLINRQKENA